MAKHHRYPTEAKRDAWPRATLANNPELRGLIRKHGALTVMGAACLLAGKVPAPVRIPKKDCRHAAPAA
jgi:hypothetical protein